MIARRRPCISARSAIRVAEPRPRIISISVVLVSARPCPVADAVPSRRTVTRSVSSRTSSRGWVTNRTPMPVAATSRTARRAARHRRAGGTTVGSSRTSSAALPSAACARPRVPARSPPGRASTGRRSAHLGASARCPSPKRPQRLARRAGARAARGCRQPCADAAKSPIAQVLEHGHRSARARGPGGRTRARAAAAAGRRAAARPARRRPRARAGVGRMVAGEDLDQRRLARAVLAQQAVDLTRQDRPGRGSAGRSSPRTSSRSSARTERCWGSVGSRGGRAGGGRLRPPPAGVPS